VRALEAGAMGGQGDRRCTPDGIPADSAFVQVDREGEPAGSFLELHVPSSGNDDPLVELRADFDTWRASHPCPSTAGGGGDAGTTAGHGGGAGIGAGAGGAAATGGIAGAVTDVAGAGSAGVAGSSSGASGSRGSSSAGGGAGVIGAGAGGMPHRLPAAAEQGGCGCRTVPERQAPAGSFWGVLALGLLVSRRWNRSAHRC
jgi:MYXO-CTERM domain-containing protein